MKHNSKLISFLCIIYTVILGLAVGYSLYGIIWSIKHIVTNL